MKTGHEIWYNDIINTNKGLILKVCSMYACNREDFRDLHQDILLQIWKASGTFRGESKISTWMYRIALNCALMKQRKASRTSNNISGEAFDFENMADSEPAIETEDFRILHTAIRRLPDFDRALIMLYLEEQPYQEISQIVGLTANNVSVRILRIKKKIKTLMEQQGYYFG
jgi:RNA polymerase sigma-70 factor, ECF subfamily